jgi:membrane fusion protein (multidrug efflux system)
VECRLNCIIAAQAAIAATLTATIQQIDPIYVGLNQSSVQGLRLRRDMASAKMTTAGPNQAKMMVFPVML